MINDMIKLEQVEYIYQSHEPSPISHKALDNVNIEIQKGDFVAVIGRNASGKSTFARLLNALQVPSKGTVFINGLNTKDPSQLWEIRRTCGMVFQNPENQIVGTIVEEDVAFGPENLGVPPELIRKRVDESLKSVGMSEYSAHAPHLLSGGQKQRIAIAGVLAMKPECIVLDEATAMLDPVGRKEVMHVLRDLNEKEKITIIHITHHMDEAYLADRVIVINDGHIELTGTPEEVFSNVEHIKGIGLEVPQVIELFYELNKEGYNMPLHIRNMEEAIKYIKMLL